MLEHSFKQGILTLTLWGRVDTANANVIENDIEEVIHDLSQKPASIVFDCADLDFISSTGLRVIMKYKKKYPDLKVINVSNDVFSVFEMTGFNRIMTVTKALRKVNLSKCKLLAQGGNGAVYRINDEEIIKVQHRAEADVLMNDEIRRSKAAFILGVPTAISFDIVDCGDGRKGAIYEALNSDTLGRYVHANPEKLEECAIKYAELLRTLHSTVATDGGFSSIKNCYLGNYERGKEFFTPEQTEQLQGILDMIPDTNTLVHADPHTNNILLGADGELLFIDMADTDLGHPVFDYCAIALAMILPQKDEISLPICGMSMAEIRQFLTIAFTHLLHLTDPEDINQLIPRLFNLSLVKCSMVITFTDEGMEMRRPQLMPFLHNCLFGNLDKVKSDIQWFIDRL